MVCSTGWIDEIELNSKYEDFRKFLVHFRNLRSLRKMKKKCILKINFMQNKNFTNTNKKLESDTKI